MKVELFPFQNKALVDLRAKTAEALGSYQRTRTPQVVSFTAPTGAGKTIIMSALIESILRGDEKYEEQHNAVIVWLSDSPQLNEQSKLKIETKADKIGVGPCETVSEESFDMETFEDGHIYFLNTQKLSVSSKLARQGDGREYTIWQTIANTAKQKSDRLYFIIDEAHRGMQGRDAARATTIMQKFIMGSKEDDIPPMPVVIGMSATMQRFNALVGDMPSSKHYCIVAPDEVRESGLLKDRIVITYPDEGGGNNDMAILQAAAADWKEKCERWKRYCAAQDCGQVNPILIVQVLNGTADSLTDTDLNECIAKIEEQTGFRLGRGEVVHTFSGTTATISVGSIEVRYEEPSRIADNMNIRVVFFKESLSTGWDCPRAETMMSFRRANDATYIAQLLGRMVRTPLQTRIQADEALNDVHLYLPYFNEETVQEVVKALQSDIPTQVIGGSSRRLETLTVRLKRAQEPSPGQLAFEGLGTQEGKAESGGQAAQGAPTPPPQEVKASASAKADAPQPAPLSPPPAAAEQAREQESAPFDREEVARFINEAGLLSYVVKPNQNSNYLKSLFRLAHLLVMSALHSKAIEEVNDEICRMMREYIEGLKAHGKYEELSRQVRSFRLSAQIFDAFGKTVESHSQPELFAATTEDIDRQVRVADRKLGSEGIPMAYGRRYVDPSDPNSYMDFKVDVILFAADEECLRKLQEYAKKRFHALDDDYRRQFASLNSERFRREHDSIASEGDEVSKHNFRLPETIQMPSEEGGKEYKSHLFVNEETGTAKIALNEWEADLIAEEEARTDFVCWIRNPPRAAWALCIPYEINGETKAMYPDFIVVRRDETQGYVLDILEPHNPEYKDNFGKAKGLAEYARHEPRAGRVQLIRMVKDAAGKSCFKRLCLEKGEVREKVLRARDIDELDHIFEVS